MKLLYLVLSLAAFLLAFFTLSGDLQTVVNFRDPLNEIVFFVLSLATGVIGFIQLKSSGTRA